MKRINNLYSKICSLENILLADSKARLGKHFLYGVRKFDEDRYNNTLKILLSLLNETFQTSEYTLSKIYEPKERILYKLPYNPDRIVHHAIMNIMEPIWVNIFTKDTYSCIKGRGIHKLTKLILKDLKNRDTTYCLKLDIKKFYPSIDHDILKNIVRKKIKDKLLLRLLDEIIDSAKGVPIGNYLSLFFANLMLTYFDHWVKEVLKVKYYYRYADDIVLLSSSKDLLRRWFIAIRLYIENELKLEIKKNYLIFPVDSRGIDFVGYVFYHTHTLIRKSIKKRIFRLIDKYDKKKITLDELLRSISSYFGWLKYCNSKHLLLKIWYKTRLHFSNWNGELKKISKFYGKKIYVVHVEPRDKYYLILFIYKNKPYLVKSKDRYLFYYLLTTPKLLCLQQSLKAQSNQKPSNH